MDRLISIEDQFGNIFKLRHEIDKVFLLSEFGKKSVLTLDSNGFLKSVINPNNEVFQLTHDNLGRLISFTKPGGQTSTVQYDNSGRVTKDVGAGGDLVELLRQFDVSSLKQSVWKKSALNVGTYYETSGDSSSSRHFISGSHGESATYTHQSQGTNTMSTSDGESSTSDQSPDPRWGWMAPFIHNYHFTVANSSIDVSQQKSITIENQDPNDVMKFSKIIETTQLQNNPELVATVTFDADKKISTLKSPRGRLVKQHINDKNLIDLINIKDLYPTHFSYNEHGLLTSIQQESRKYDYSYDKFGNLSALTLPTGQVTQFYYDKANRLTKQIYPDHRVAYFSYDANGNLKAMRPPGKKSHEFDYNSMDLISQYLPPVLNGGLETPTTYTYNLDRKISSIQKPGNVAIYFNYNSTSGLLETINTPDGNYYYGYPAYTKRLQFLTSPDNADLNIRYYGASFLKSYEWENAFLGKVSFDYNSNATVSAVTTSDNDASLTVALRYDKDGLLNAAGNLGLQRGSYGQVTKTKIGKVNGDHSYSGFGETVVDTYKMNDQLLYQRRYNRDPLGKIQGVVESGSATKSTQYVYNVRGKLADVIENGQKVRSYNYDANGNRLFLKNGHVTTNYKYDAQDRLIRAGSMSFEYTPSGELLKSVMNKKVTSYKYDAFGNLKSVTLPDARRIEYLVDGLHRRVAKKINGQMVQGFLYQSQTQIAAEVDGQNRIVKRFVYGEKLNIPDYMIYQKKNYRIISDQVGTPRMLIEVKTGNVVAQYNYDEFGVLISRSGSVDIPFGFAGGLKDDDTGLVRFGARDYNPSMGRWTAKDPILFNGGDTNLYGYVLNDPVNFVDMNGKNPLLIVGIGATVGAVANVIGTALAGGSIQDIGRSAVTGSIAGAAATLGAVGAVGLGASTALTVTLSSLVDITVQLSFAPDQFENLQEYSSGIENLIKPKVQQFCE